MARPTPGVLSLCASAPPANEFYVLQWCFEVLRRAAGRQPLQGTAASGSDCPHGPTVAGNHPFLRLSLILETLLSAPGRRRGDAIAFLWACGAAGRPANRNSCSVLPAGVRTRFFTSGASQPGRGRRSLKGSRPRVAAAVERRQSVAVARHQSSRVQSRWAGQAGSANAVRSRRECAWHRGRDAARRAVVSLAELCGAADDRRRKVAFGIAPNHSKAEGVF